MNFSNRRELVIEWGHCDPARIVFNRRYFEFADWSSALLFEAAFDMSISKIKAKYNAEMPLVDVRGRFMKPLTVADVVEIVSKIDMFKRSSFMVMHLFFNRGELVADVQEMRVWVGIDPEEPWKFKAKPIPAEVTERFKIA